MHGDEFFMLEFYKENIIHFEVNVIISISFMWMSICIFYFCSSHACSKMCFMFVVLFFSSKKKYFHSYLFSWLPCSYVCDLKMLRKKCRLWWPEQLVSSQPNSSFLFVGWYICSINSLDIIVATTISPHEISPCLLQSNFQVKKVVSIFLRKIIETPLKVWPFYT